MGNEYAIYLYVPAKTVERLGREKADEFARFSFTLLIDNIGGSIAGEISVNWSEYMLSIKPSYCLRVSAMVESDGDIDPSFAVTGR